ncbi:MAG TPA: THUMP domain-containing protein [Candidatus Dormibacteraeota bacterium]|nr:THUMP domain-containing protein [Candidatus Dormibacteraeota bacterium]
MSDEPSSLEPPEWNVLVTTREGEQRAVRRALWRLVRLRPSGYRNVRIGHADDVDGMLAGIADLIERGALRRQQLGRVLPIARTFRVDAAQFDAQLRAATDPLLPQLAGRRFHVRIERRGHKGVIHTAESERALGDHLGSELEARGAYAGIDFRDPDIVLAVELIGDRGGVALVTRELRERFPFVHID